MPVLDLSGADTSGFDALPAGSYHCEVYKVEMQETKGGPNAKLPAGTPRMNVQFRVLGKTGEAEQGEESPHYNRRLFNGYTFPPAKAADGSKYPADKAAKMKGMIARFFVALGYTEEEVVSNEFAPDFEEMPGRACIVTIKVKQKYNGAEGELDNEVTGVKPAQSNALATSGLL